MEDHLYDANKISLLSFPTSEASNRALKLVKPLHFVVTYLWILFTYFFGLLAIWKHMDLFSQNPYSRSMCIFQGDIGMHASFAS